MLSSSTKPKDGEQRVTGIPSEARQTPDPSRMSAEEYLDRYSVSAYVKDLLTVLLENRPEEPIEFLADYFNCAVNGVSPVMRTYRYVRLTKRDRQAFMDNLSQAYALMARNSEIPSSGLTGAQYVRLLHMVCADFPPEIVQSLMQVLDKKESDTISFPVFVAGINTCLLYEEFFEDAEKLFNACDTNGSGRVEQQVFMAIIRHMNSQSQDATRLDQGWLVPGTFLMDRVAASLSKLPPVDGRAMMTFKDFVAALIQVFLAHGDAAA